MRKYILLSSILAYSVAFTGGTACADDNIEFFRRFLDSSPDSSGSSVYEGKQSWLRDVAQTAPDPSRDQGRSPQSQPVLVAVPPPVAPIARVASVPVSVPAPSTQPAETFTDVDGLITVMVQPPVAQQHAGVDASRQYPTTQHPHATAAPIALEAKLRLPTRILNRLVPQQQAAPTVPQPAPPAQQPQNAPAAAASIPHPAPAVALTPSSEPRIHQVEGQASNAKPQPLMQQPVPPTIATGAMPEVESLPESPAVEDQVTVSNQTPGVEAKTVTMSTEVDEEAVAKIENRVKQQVNTLQARLETEEQRLQQQLELYAKRREAALEKNDEKSLQQVEQAEQTAVKNYERRVQRLLSQAGPQATSTPLVKQPASRRGPASPSQQPQPFEKPVATKRPATSMVKNQPKQSNPAARRTTGISGNSRFRLVSPEDLRKASAAKQQAQQKVQQAQAAAKKSAAKPSPQPSKKRFRLWPFGK